MLKDLYPNWPSYEHTENVELILLPIRNYQTKLGFMTALQNHFNSFPRGVITLQDNEVQWLEDIKEIYHISQDTIGPGEPFDVRKKKQEKKLKKLSRK
jgi:hypothetical protein